MMPTQDRLELLICWPCDRAWPAKKYGMTHCVRCGERLRIISAPWGTIADHG